MRQAKAQFLRYRSVRPNHRGIHVGVFGLVNVLGRQGMLTEAEEALRIKHNAWYDAAYADPSASGTGAYDTADAEAWFRVDGASELLNRIHVYTDILDAHRIAWECIRSDDPGLIIYEDDVQIVARPYDC